MIYTPEQMSTANEYFREVLSEMEPQEFGETLNLSMNDCTDEEIDVIIDDRFDYLWGLMTTEDRDVYIEEAGANLLNI